MAGSSLVKELAAFVGQTAPAAQRFVLEARLAGSLSHPNIVTVHDYFVYDGRPYIAMEYLPRGSLRSYMRSLTLAPGEGVFEGCSPASRTRRPSGSSTATSSPRTSW